MDSGFVLCTPDTMVCALPPLIVNVVGTRAATVVEKVMTGRPATDAVTVDVPAVAPEVKVVDALPVASVTADVAPSEPPPLVIAYVTVVPAIGVPVWSTTRTTNGLVACAPVTTVCPPPLAEVTVAAERAATVTLKLAGLTPDTDAVIVAVPAVVPAVYVTDATPLASVDAAVVLRVPPPELMANVTGTADSAAPF